MKPTPPPRPPQPKTERPAPPAAPKGLDADLEAQLVAAFREHLGVCNALLELAHKEAEALKDPAPFPAMAIQIERKALLTRLESALKELVQTRNLWQQSGKESAARQPQIARWMQTALDTIMRLLVLDRENERELLRRGLLPARSLPPAEQARPNYIAQLYQRHRSA